MDMERIYPEGIDVELFKECGTSRLDVKGEIQIAKSIRMRVLMQGTRAEQLVVVTKEL